MVTTISMSTADHLAAALDDIAHLNLTEYIDVEEELMAAGGFYDVYRGVDNRSGTMVAIKRVRINLQDTPRFQKVSDSRHPGNSYSQPLQMLVKEIKIWSKLNHRNILLLKGFTMEGAYTRLITDWMANGNLKVYLRRFPDSDKFRLVRMHFW